VLIQRPFLNSVFFEIFLSFFELQENTSGIISNRRRSFFTN